MAHMNAQLQMFPYKKMPKFPKVTSEAHKLPTTHEFFELPAKLHILVHHEYSVMHIYTFCPKTQHLFQFTSK